MCGVTVTSSGNPVEAMDDCLQLHCHADKLRLLWMQVKTYTVAMHQI